MIWNIGKQIYEAQGEMSGLNMEKMVRAIIFCIFNFHLMYFYITINRQIIGEDPYKWVKCMDQFPRRPHVETLILMTRCGKNDK